MADDAGEGLERLAYELSLQALGQQEGALNELRARTGILIAATSIVASFLGARAAEAGSRAWLNVLALAAFAVSILASSYVLLPRQGLVFSLSGSALLEAESEDPEGLHETYRRLSYWLDGYRRANGDRIGRLTVGFGVAAIALVVQAILWTVNLYL